MRPSRRSATTSSRISAPAAPAVCLAQHAADRQMCDRVVFIDRGTVKMQGDPDEVCTAYENEILTAPNGRAFRLRAVRRRRNRRPFAPRLCGGFFVLRGSYRLAGGGNTRSSSASQTAAGAIGRCAPSPRGESEPPEEIFGPLGTAERLNWLVRKNRRRKGAQPEAGWSPCHKRLFCPRSCWAATAPGFPHARCATTGRRFSTGASVSGWCGTG